MCTEICDGAGAGICDGAPSTCSSFHLTLVLFICSLFRSIRVCEKGKRKVQGVPQSQAVALPRHQEEEKTDKTKQAQIEQTYEKH